MSEHLNEFVDKVCKVTGVESGDPRRKEIWELVCHYLEGNPRFPDSELASDLQALHKAAGEYEAALFKLVKQSRWPMFPSAVRFRTRAELESDIKNRAGSLNSDVAMAQDGGVPLSLSIRQWDSARYGRPNSSLVDCVHVKFGEAES